jgi:hypothetical protein
MWPLHIPLLACSNPSQLHAKEQDLDCPGCGKHFTRLGSLIAHIEFNDCKAVTRENIVWARKEKEKSNAAVKTAHDFQDFSRSGVLDEGPNPLATSFGIPQQPQQVKAAVAPPPKPVFDGDNLLGGFDVLNLPWSPEPAGTKSVPSTADFPSLSGREPSIMDAQNANIAPNSAWAVKKDLFPAVAIAKTPAPAAPSSVSGMLLRSQDAPKPDPKPNPHDPSHPQFNSGRYWISFLGKFKCPYLGCG